MGNCALIVLLALVSQAPSPELQEPATYVVQLKAKAGQAEPPEPVCGFISDEDIKKPSVRVEVDAPWNPRKEVKYIPETDIASIEREWSGRREKRIREGYEKAGFVEIRGQWWPKDEVAWADKARLAAGITEPWDGVAGSRAPEQPAQAATVSPAETESPLIAHRGFWAQWWRHVVVVAVGLLLMGAIGKTMVFGSKR